MTKEYWYFSGGLGDVLFQYFRRGDIADPAPSTDGPAYRRVVLNSHNPQAVELFRHHPAVNEIVFVPFAPGFRQDIVAGLLAEGLTPGEPRHVPLGTAAHGFPLSPEDESYLARVLPPGPFVVFHPGAGKPDFALHGVLPFAPLLDAAASRGVSVVMVGGPSFRHLTERGESRWMPERNPVGPHPALVDLVGAANPRLVCEITRRSVGFVGSLSCYVWAAVHHRKPSVCIVPDGHAADYVQRAVESGVVVRQFSEIAWALPDELFRPALA